MLGFISKMFGGSKSEKDIKSIQPMVQKINEHFASLQSLNNDELRGKTVEFRERIRKHLSELDQQIQDLTKRGEELPFSDITGKDAIYQEVDELKKKRDKEVEVILNELLPEAFAVVKETARRFKENTEIVSTATEHDRNLSITKDYIRIEGDKVIYQ